MAITQIGSTTTATTTDPSATLTISKTTDLLAGDILVAAITSNGDAQTAPSGWVNFDGSTLAPTVAWQCQLYYRIVTGSEGSNFSWTVGTGGPSAGHMTAWREVHNTSPIAGTSDAIVNSGSDPYTTPALTPASGTGMLFYVRAVRKTSAGGTGGTLTETDTDVMNHTPGVSGVSSTGNTAYVVNVFHRITQYTTGGSKAGLATTFSATPSQNYGAQFALQEYIAVAPDAGTAAPTTTANKPTPKVGVKAQVIG